MLASWRCIHQDREQRHRPYVLTHTKQKQQTTLASAIVLCNFLHAIRMPDGPTTTMHSVEFCIAMTNNSWSASVVRCMVRYKVSIQPALYAAMHLCMVHHWTVRRPTASGDRKLRAMSAPSSKNL